MTGDTFVKDNDGREPPMEFPEAAITGSGAVLGEGGVMGWEEGREEWNKPEGWMLKLSSLWSSLSLCGSSWAALLLMCRMYTVPTNSAIIESMVDSRLSSVLVFTRMPSPAALYFYS